MPPPFSAWPTISTLTERSVLMRRAVRRLIAACRIGTNSTCGMNSATATSASQRLHDEHIAEDAEKDAAVQHGLGESSADEAADRLHFRDDHRDGDALLFRAVPVFRAGDRAEASRPSAGEGSRLRPPIRDRHSARASGRPAPGRRRHRRGRGSRCSWKPSPSTARLTMRRCNSSGANSSRNTPIASPTSDGSGCGLLVRQT